MGDFMNLIIGVLGRPKTMERDITSFSKAVTDVIIKYGHIPLGIIAPVSDVNNIMPMEDIIKLHNIIDLCDGIILQGGSDYYQYDLETIKYIYEKNIPLLGICLGMQSIGVAFGASLAPIADHNHPGDNYVHPVKIEKQSSLYRIVHTDTIMVNSRHNEMIINPSDAKVIGTCDGTIEAIEKEGTLFILGVQWHPEDMVSYDENSRKIFEALFSSCELHYKNKHN